MCSCITYCKKSFKITTLKESNRIVYIMLMFRGVILKETRMRMSQLWIVSLRNVLLLYILYIWFHTRTFIFEKIYIPVREQTAQHAIPASLVSEGLIQCWRMMSSVRGASGLQKFSIGTASQSMCSLDVVLRTLYFLVDYKESSARSYSQTRVANDISRERHL